MNADDETPEPVFPSSDSVGLGCLYGCLSQIAFIAVGIGLAFFIASPKLSVYLLVGWGLTQWIAIVPLIVRQRAAGHSSTVQGLIITGCIGVLLSSACAGYVHIL